MKKLFKTLSATIVISIIIILLKNEYARLLLSNANYGMQSIINSYSISDIDSTNSSLILFNGSSMFRQGLDINELQNTLGENVYILSYNGNQPFLEYYEITYLLDNHVQIDHLYIDMYAFSLQAEPWVHDNKIFLDTNMQFKTHVWKQLFSYGNMNFSDLWEMFITSNNYELLTWPITHSIINNRFFCGGNISETTPANKKTLDSANASFIANDKLNTEQICYLIKLIKLCKQNDINLSFIETPKYISIGNNENYLSLMEQYCNILNQYDVNYTLSESTSSALGDKDLITFDNSNPDYYIDTLHLSSEGRKKFTSALADVIE